MTDPYIESFIQAFEDGSSIEVGMDPLQAPRHGPLVFTAS